MVGRIFLHASPHLELLDPVLRMFSSAPGLPLPLKNRVYGLFIKYVEINSGMIGKGLQI